MYCDGSSGGRKVLRLPDAAFRATFARPGSSTDRFHRNSLFISRLI